MTRWTTTVPGDKSLTHRALMLAALADGACRVEAALDAGDPRTTAAALAGLGVDVAWKTGMVTVRPRAGQPFVSPTEPIDCGNSGTTARLLLGVVAGLPVTATFTGDASLRGRPMRRVTDPLTEMGACIEELNGPDRLPLRIRGGNLHPVEYETPVASAQIKSAILLAGLTGGVEVRLREPGVSRDHTERMLRSLGVDLEVEGHSVRLRSPGHRLPAFRFTVPGDPSSAAFLLAAAVLAGVPVNVEQVGLNPTRIGFVPVFERMGIAVGVEVMGEELGEPFGRLSVDPPATLHPVTVDPAEIPSLIDEIPVLAVLASRAEGVSVMQGVAELRVKESDRLALIAANLRALGGEAVAGPDRLEISGCAPVPGGVVETGNDHRLAMAFALLDLVPGAEVGLNERTSPRVSFPGFFEALDEVRRRAG